MDNTKINTKEAIALVLTVAVSHSLLAIPKDLMTNQKSAAILNIAYVTIITVIFAYLIYRLFKAFPGKDILDVSDFLGGKILKTILGILFILYFSFTASILLRNFCESIKIVYFPNTKVEFIITFFISAIIIVCSLDFKSNIKVNYIIMPLVLISILFLFFSNLKNFSPDRMFPILGEGFNKTFIKGIKNIYAFGGISLLYFLPPLLREPEKFKKISIYSILLSGIYLLIAISIILFMFAYFVNVDEIMPLFSAARNIEFGSFFQRLESVFLLIWLVIFACYISIMMTFSLEATCKIANLKDKKPLAPVFGLLFLGISLLPKDLANSNTLERSVYPIATISLCFILTFILLIMANLKKRKDKV